jgi:hypothetical protein
MAIIERMTHYPPKMSWDIMDKEAKYSELEAKFGGFPPKKYMVQKYGGRETAQAFIWEREWESVEVMEQTYRKAYHNNPEFNEIQKMEPEYGPQYREIFTIIEPRKP